MITIGIITCVLALVLVWAAGSMLFKWRRMKMLEWDRRTLQLKSSDLLDGPIYVDVEEEQKRG